MSPLIGTAEGAFEFGNPEPLIGGIKVNHLVANEDDWWALGGDGQIHHQGEAVAQIPDGAPGLCIQPTPETVWIGSSEGRLFGLEDGEVGEDEFFSTAPGREAWYTPWGAPADVRSMTIDADHTLYINVHVGGILRYDNTGIVPTLDIDADVHQVAAHPTQKGAVFAATAYGLAQSHNGHDFDFRTEGLHSSYCRAVAALEDRVLISASSGPRTRQGRLYAGDLWEGPLEPMTTGLPEWFDGNLNTHCIAAASDGVYIGYGSTVWRSEDEGRSWTEALTGLPRITCLA